MLRSRYEQVPANERRHYPIQSMGIELGIWHDRYQNLELPWLRWWDNQGNLLLRGWENTQRLAALVKRIRR
jgi:hypothetical protein